MRLEAAEGGGDFMPGADFVFAMLVLAGTPEVPDARSAERKAVAPAKPIASAVELARKWGVVTSVRRSPEHNRAVGGAENSFHLLGRAVDIARRPGVRHAEIEAAYRRAGYALIESFDEGDHSHFAFGLIGSPPKPDLVRPEQFTSSSEVEHSMCAALSPPSANARRRPDRSGGCPEAPNPAPRLRPLEPAP